MCAMALSQLRRGFLFSLYFTRMDFMAWLLKKEEREKATRHLHKRCLPESGGEGNGRAVGRLGLCMQDKGALWWQWTSATQERAIVGRSTKRNSNQPSLATVPYRHLLRFCALLENERATCG